MSGSHPRNTGNMLASPRCGAITRKGTPCQAPAVQGKARCRMHGGAQGSGAPRHNSNARKTGEYGAEAKRFRQMIRRALGYGREALK